MTSNASESPIEEMDLLLQEVRSRNAMPLWEVNAQRGRPTVQPFLWRYADYRDLLYRAADVVPMEIAERRVFVFSNPGIDAHSATSTLLANLQIIKPGEIARSHRHAPSALRLVIEGQGAYTSVNGEKSYMDPGDFVTTPSWTWHGHGNEGDGPMVWLDGLDVPFVQSLDANFYEQYPEEIHPLTKPDDLSLRMFGAGSLTPTWERPDSPNSPILNYKFERTYAALKALAEDTDGSPYDGITVEYTNPLNGGPAMPTIACFATLLRAGQRTEAHRHVGGTVYHVIQGTGSTVIAGTRFDWAPKDTFVVPSWHFHEHAADEEAVLFSYNDGPVLQALNLYREEAMDAPTRRKRASSRASPAGAKRREESIGVGASLVGAPGSVPYP